MIAPLTPFAIRGVIWYQGEANAARDRAPLYARLFPTMIRDWRRAWGEGDFPFLFVQIANWNTEPDGCWPEVRDAQRQALALRNTGMAVTIDIGDAVDIHPKNKQDVGLRLSLAARAIAYGEKIEWSGPLYRQVTQEESRAARVVRPRERAGSERRGAYGIRSRRRRRKVFRRGGEDRRRVGRRIERSRAEAGVSSLRMGAESNLQSRE